MKKNILVVFVFIFMIFGIFSCLDNSGNKEKIKVNNEKKQDLEKDNNSSILDDLGDKAISARDGKRRLDVATLAQKISSKLVFGTELSSLVRNGKPINLNGYSGEYGDINYSILGVDSKDFLDPISDKPYKYLYLEGGEAKDLVECFEIGTFLEKKKKNFVKGNCVAFSALSGKVENPKLNNSLFSQKGSKTLKDLIEK